MRDFFNELRRRNVFRVAMVYAATAFVVLQVADIVLPSLGVPGWALSLVVVLVFLGFPLALVLAWALELTPEGIRRAHRGPVEAATTPALLDRRTVLISALLVAVGIGLGAGWILKPDSPAPLDAGTSAVGMPEADGPDLTAPDVQHSIAVLAFDDMSPNRDQEYLSDGIAEELLNLLSGVAELRVISRSSSFSFKGQNLEIRDIAERLDVDHVLEGSVRKAGDRVRITANLVDARQDRSIWSERYERTLEDIFAIQDEIAAEVVGQLKVTLLDGLPAVRETDPEAYQLYLKARHLGRMMSAETFEQSSALYRQALDIDSEFADAFSGLGQNYSNQAGFGLIPAERGYARAREFQNQALAIEPEHALAHSRLGAIALRFDHDLATAAWHGEQALALAPADAAVLHFAASLLRHLGRLDEAIDVRESLLALDPLNPITQVNRAWDYFYAGRLDEALEAWQEALRLSPGYQAAHFGVGSALLARGEPEAAREAFEREPFEAVRLQGLALAAYELGELERFHSLHDELVERQGHRFPALVAGLHAHIGDADAAFEWLDRAAETNRIDYALLDPAYRPLHQDPRWHAFLERIGATPEQLRAIEFDLPLEKIADG